MFDIHCHLEYMEEPEEVIKEARSRMNGFITAVADPKDFDKIMRIADKNPDFVFVSAGFHPERTEKYSEKEIDEYIEKIAMADCFDLLRKSEVPVVLHFF